tara:strand:+ start:1671 stop:2588 length:918 start_codon:yes stop_codon:yes gene_type:complete
MEVEAHMKCPECECESSYFNDAIGEMICRDCGLVLYHRPFEETTSIIRDGQQTHEVTNRLGSYMGYPRQYSPTNSQFSRMKRQHVWASSLTEADRETITRSRMIMSNYKASKSIMDKVETYLKSLKEEHVLRGCTVEQRAASLTYYILKESQIPVNLKTHSKFSYVESKYVSRWAKRIAKHFRNASVFTHRNIMAEAISIIDRLESHRRIDPEYRMKALRLIKHIEQCYKVKQMRLSPNLIIASLWVAGKMENIKVTQAELVDASGSSASTSGVRVSLHALCEVFGLTKEDMCSLSVSDFVAGAY